MSRVQCVRRPVGWQTGNTWCNGKRPGWWWEEEDAEGLLTLHSVLRSAGEPGYVTVIIMRGRPGLMACQPLAIQSCLSSVSTGVAKRCESVGDALQASVNA